MSVVSSGAMSAAAGPIRLLLVEDVPQVAQYVRGLLNAQSQIKLVDVVTDGGRAVSQARQLRPDVVIVDWLLQGRTKGEKVVAQMREAGLGIPVAVVTVPQSPVVKNPAAGIDAVLGMPFSGFELVNVVVSIHQAAQVANDSIRSKLLVVYAPKGGVGKTTLAFNLAVALGQAGTRTALVDGSLQFGDLRSLLRVPADAPSILDLPTDRIGESDLQDVLWRDPSGIDILLAPPRVEMAEMVSVRDVEKALSLLRRLYGAVVVDMPSALGDIPLALLDAADTILEIVTYDSTTIRNTLAVAEAFRAIGYPAVQGPLRRQPRRLDRRDRGRGPRARARARAGAHDRVRRHARRAGQQRGPALRPRQPGRPDQPRHRPAGRRPGRAPTPVPAGRR